MATEIPAETMRACARAMTAARAVADCGNPSAKSDVAVGLQLLTAATQGALYNVATNIGSLKDAAVADRIVSEVKATMQEPMEAVRSIYSSGGVFELMKEAAQRFGVAAHGQPPSSVSPEVLIPPAMHLLQRIGTAEARRALEAFAGSPDAATRTAATTALAQFPA